MRRVALTEVCSFQGGSQPPKSVWKKEIEPGYVRMLQIRDFTQPEKNKIEFVPDKKSLKKCQANDILIGRYGASIGKICHGLAGAYNVALIRVITDEDIIQSEFLLHLLKGRGFQHFIQNIGGRAAQAGFNKEDLTEFKFFLPPLEEQKKIAAILDAADDYRQKTKALIEKYEQLTQSLFLDMFGDPVTNPMGWTLSPLGEAIDVRDGTHDSPKYIHEGYPLITSKNIVDGKLNFNDVNLISKSDFDNINKRSKVDYGDIIMPMIGTIGNPVEVLTTKSFAIKNVALFKKNTDSPLLIPILLMLLKGHYLLHYSLMNNRGGTQKFLSLGAIRKMPIFLPPLSLQNQFAERVAQIEKQKQQAEATLVKAEELFSSLLQRAFKGDLTS